MESILGLIGVFVVMGCIKLFNGRRHEQMEKKESEEMRQGSVNSQQEDLPEREKPDTLGLMLNTLNQLGCQPTANDDGSLSVQYQGENFHMEFGGMYARIWDPMWAGIKMDDPELSTIREAVNVANFNFGPTVVMTAPNDEGVISLHSRRDIMLHPSCPDNVPFVKSVLDSFFDAKEAVRKNVRQINIRQMETQQSRRPVGFNTNSSD